MALGTRSPLLQQVGQFVQLNDALAVAPRLVHGAALLALLSESGADGVLIGVLPAGARLLALFRLLSVSPDRQRPATLVPALSKLFVLLVHRSVEFRVVVDIVLVLILCRRGRLALNDGHSSAAIVDLHEAMFLDDLQLRVLSVKASRL